MLTLPVMLQQKPPWCIGAREARVLPIFSRSSIETQAERRDSFDAGESEGAGQARRRHRTACGVERRRVILMATNEDPSETIGFLEFSFRQTAQSSVLGERWW
jgi:hypothetical protein